MIVTGVGLALDAASCSISEAAISARRRVPEAPKLSMPSARLYSRWSRCSQVKPMPPSDWIAVSQTMTALSPAYDFAAAAAIDACASPVATHHAAHSASERESSTRVYASASGCETAW